MRPAVGGLLFCILLSFHGTGAADFWDGLDWVEQQVEGALAGVNEGGDELSEEKPTFTAGKDIEEKMQQGMEECHKKCSEQHPPQSNGWGPCLTGCVSMEKHLRRLNKQFPDTRQEYLAGNALDSCWTDCHEEQPDSLADCKVGCDNMRTLIKDNKKSGTEPKLINVKSGTELEANKAKSGTELEANKAKSGTELTDSKAKSGTELEDGPHRKATAAAAAGKEGMKATSAEAEDSDSETVYLWVGNGDLIRYLQLKRLLNWISYMNMVFQQSTLERQGAGGSRSDDAEDSLSWSEYSAPATKNAQVTDESFLDQAKKSLDQVKVRMQANLGSYGWDDFILIIIVGLSFGILVSSLLECIFCRKKRTEIKATDNYYTLKGEPYNPVLPTYDDCVKMDKHYFASLHTPGEQSKSSLNNLPVIWVQDIKEKL